LIDPSAAQQVRKAVEEQINKTITEEDSSRWIVANQIVAATSASTPTETWTRAGATTPAVLGLHTIELNDCTPSTSFVRYEDVQERHGSFVTTRGSHQLKLPPRFRIAKYLVTNQVYMDFVSGGGYDDDGLWIIPKSSRAVLLTADGQTLGPGDWPSATSFPSGKAEHPVSGICFFEAQAFVNWLSCKATPEPNWAWSLPPEDLWEFAARSEAGLIYPWGDAFDASKCNASESGIGGTSEVTRFAKGASSSGCFDMAGNVWEFVLALDSKADSCVLRGGSYKNAGSEVRSYLRLTHVPRSHRPPDFGFRLVQVEG
jgi:formylglycine-generating enzyme required for sulfatase activity